MLWRQHEGISCFKLVLRRIHRQSFGLGQFSYHVSHPHHTFPDAITYLEQSPELSTTAKTYSNGTGVVWPACPSLRGLQYFLIPLEVDAVVKDPFPHLPSSPCMDDLLCNSGLLRNVSRRNGVIDPKSSAFWGGINSPLIIGVSFLNSESSYSDSDYLEGWDPSAPWWATPTLGRAALQYIEDGCASLHLVLYHRPWPILSCDGLTSLGQSSGRLKPNPSPLIFCKALAITKYTNLKCNPPC